MALEIVGSCPRCGCPIYGWKAVDASTTPVIKRTCTCVEQQLQIPSMPPLAPWGMVPCGSSGTISGVGGSTAIQDRSDVHIQW